MIRVADPRHRLGREAEAFVAAELARRGWRLLDRRFRAGGGELDLVALDGRCVVFIEVKARRSSRYGTAAEAVTPRKRQRLAAAALAWLQRHERWSQACRFDVVEVAVWEGGRLSSHWIEDAFRPV